MIEGLFSLKQPVEGR